jgi:hypothetical protein
MKNFEIVERSSGYWIVGSYGVAWYDPFDDYEDAIAKLHELNRDDLYWIGLSGVDHELNDRDIEKYFEKNVDNHYNTFYS